MPPEPSSKGVRRLPIGKYEIVSHIATGGMGAVYKARDSELGRDVALKVLSPEVASTPNMLARFRREANHASKLKHENIVELYEFGEANGINFLALEYIDGIDLYEHIKRTGQLGVKESVDLITQATKALVCLHQHGIVHRDIKPSNFLVTQKNGKPVVKLIDLGLARVPKEDEFRITRASHTVGTVDYMSPEQARDSGNADIRSDIYSLGCTWYHLLTGEPPFSKGSLAERIYQHIEAEPPDVRELNANVPGNVAKILKRMLAKDPKDRYQTPEALLRDLQPSTRTPGGSDEEGEDHHGAAGRRKRTGGKHRSHEDEDTREVAGAKTLPGFGPGGKWWLWAAGGGAGLVAILAGIAFLVFGSGKPKPSDQNTPVTVVLPSPENRGETNRRPTTEPTKVEPGPTKVEPGPTKVEPGPTKVEPGPTKTALPRIYTPLVAIDPVSLRDELEKPWQGLEAPPVNPIVYRVSRLDQGGDGRYFNTLAAACDKAPAGQETVIELNDNGPDFELPAAVKGRSLRIRAGKGYRPLIAWDAQNGEAAKVSPFLTVEQGNLALEDLDIVLKCVDLGQKDPTVLVRVTDGALSAKGCSFSVAGKQPAGVVALRVEETTPAQSKRCRCRLDRCVVRGSSITAIELRAIGAEVLLNGCLVVGGNRPLLDVTGLNPLFPTGLSVIRSTLVAGQTLLRVRAAAGTDISTAAVHWQGWDALLARCATQTGGEMVVLQDGANPGALQWRPINCLYTGWKTLLASRDETKDDIGGWRRVFGYGEGDQAMSQTWPLVVHPEPAEIPAGDYGTVGTSAAFAASFGPGALGCDLEALPPGREGWLRLTYDQYVPAPVAVPSGTSAPDIPDSSDGLYHGERLDLSQADLGEYLQKMQRAKKFGSKVVMILAGGGERKTSPIRIKGSSLVLYFEPPADPKDNQMTLRPNGDTVQDREALIEVEDGSLEIIGGAIQFMDSKLAPIPAYMLKISGGNLILSGSRLQGPLAQQPAPYKGLISFGGSGEAAADRANGCAISNAILVSTKSLIKVVGTGAQLRLENCVAVAGADMLDFAVGAEAKGRLNLQCLLDHNTIAPRRAVAHVPDLPNLGAPAEPIVLQAKANAYLDAFTDAPHRATLLLYEGMALNHGLLVWQGSDNLYDKRLSGYALPAEGPATDAKQDFKTWLRLWGRPGIRQPLSNLALSNKLDVENLKLEALALPPLPPPKPQVVPGADLVQLGIVKKKGPKK